MKKIFNSIKEIYDESYFLPPLTIFVGSCIFVYLCMLVGMLFKK